MNSEVYKNILSAQIQPNAAKLFICNVKRRPINDPKHTAKATQELI